MGIHPRKQIPTLWAIFWSATAFCSAQDKPADNDPYKFSIRVYRLPAEDLRNAFVSKDKGKLRAPSLPPPSASHGELEAFLKRDHEVIKEYLAQNGITLPPGSLACYDPDTQTLALRAMAVVHSLVEPLADAELRARPKCLTWSMTILEAPADAVRDAMTEATGQPDHGAAFEHLLPKAKIISAMHGETKGGQRTTLEQGGAQDSIADIAVGNRQAEYHLEQLRGGTVLELDPVIGTDGQTIDLSLSLQHHPVPPQSRWQAINARVGSKIEIQYRDPSIAKIQTAITLLDGGVKLIGIWEKRTPGEVAPAAPLLQAAFLREGVAAALAPAGADPEGTGRGRGADAEGRATRC